MPIVVIFKFSFCKNFSAQGGLERGVRNIKIYNNKIVLFKNHKRRLYD